MEEIEIEEPTGKFILDNLPIEKRVITANGLYIHYSDVCQLLKKYHEDKVKKLSKAVVSGQFCRFGCELVNETWYAKNGHKCANAGGQNCH